MTPITFAAYIRQKTRTNSSSFSDAAIMALANPIKDELAGMIVQQTGEDYFLREYTRNLEAGKRRYGFPADLLGKVKFVEAKLDGSQWITFDEVDFAGENKPTAEASIIAEFSNRDPGIELYARGLMIYSGAAMVAVTDGLKLWAFEFPADLTSLAGSTDMSVNPSDTSFGMPREFHKLWATKVIIEYKESKEKPIPLSEREQNIDKEIERQINLLRGGNQSRQVVASAPRNTGEQY